MSSLMPVGGVNPLTRPIENPTTRWAPGAPAMPQTRLPLGALRMPNPIASPAQGVGTTPMPQAFPRSPEGLEHRVSTRIPTSAKLTVDPHERADISAGLPAMLALDRHHFDEKHHDEARASIAEALKTNADTIRQEYPHIDTRRLSDRGVHERFIEHAHDNIHWLWNKVRSEPWAPLAAQWYTGANRMAKSMAQEFRVSPRQAAGVIATLSPRKDWDQNVDIARRVLNIHANHQETAITPQMRAKIDEYVGKRTPERAGALELMANGGEDKKEGGTIAPMAVGTRLRDLEHPMQKGLFARAYDEAHGPGKGYDIISPAGARVRAMVGTEGSRSDPRREATVTWSGFDHLANAMRVLESDHLPGISRALGSMHKVRNFYNNIISPDAAAFLHRKHADATVDTHQINVANLLPMGGSHRIVGQGLGQGSGVAKPAFTGSKGLYPLHIEALRRAADTISKQEGRRYLPREVQSVVWEAIRSMFPEHTKGYDEAGRPQHNVGEVARDSAFAARHGFMPREMARDALLRHITGGTMRINPPNWWRG
jgi:hypothetical protein